ncbi:MAG: hypothetical protein ACK4WH_07850 [Phycisphaerales bacterium]
MAELRTNEDGLYVGYRELPARERRFLRVGVPALLWILCGLSVVWARAQHAPGGGSWDLSAQVSLRGVLVCRPYPALVVRDNDGAESAVLLVEVGKLGADRRAGGLDGKSVEVTGWRLERDGRRMIELDPGAGAIVVQDDRGQGAREPRVESLGRVRLRGEIVDSKCYLGAMKPGEGKTHKECATLCIRGGVPPVLVVRRPDGGRAYYLLRDLGGGPIAESLHGLIADPVEVVGELSRWGGLNVLSVGAEGVRRL